MVFVLWIFQDFLRGDYILAVQCLVGLRGFWGGTIREFLIVASGVKFGGLPGILWGLLLASF